MGANFENTLRHCGSNGGNDFLVIRVSGVEKFGSGLFETCHFQVSMTRRAYILYGQRVIRGQGGASFNLDFNGRFGNFLFKNDISQH